MKAKILLGVILVLLAVGCFGLAGDGESSGIVTTAGWNKTFGRDYPYLWFRANEASSNTDCYVLNQNNLGLLEKAKKYAKTREEVTIFFTEYRAGSVCTYCSNRRVDNIELRKPSQGKPELDTGLRTRNR